MVKQIRQEEKNGKQSIKSISKDAKTLNEMFASGSLKVEPLIDSVVSENFIGEIYDLRQVSPIVFVGPQGCHAKGQKIMMSDGSLKRVEDIIVGDQLMGDDSFPRTVSRLYSGVDDLFDIVPTKGEKFTVNSKHILTLAFSRGHKDRAWENRKNGEITDIPLDEYLAFGKYKQGHHLLVRTPVSFRAIKELPIDPYLLGLLLGDGTLCGGVGITTSDDKIVKIIYAHAQKLKLPVRETKNPDRCKTYFFSSVFYMRKHAHPLVDALKRLGLYGRKSAGKFIPFEYKTASRQNRLALLAGMLDSDGSIDKHSRKCFDWISKSSRMANDIVFLARSLGFAAYANREIKSSLGEGSARYYFRVCISGDTHLIPTILDRKKAGKREQKKNVLRTGFTVVKKGKGKYFGFEIDGNQRYLLDDFTVTHNTGKTLSIFRFAKDNDYKLLVVDCSEDLRYQHLVGSYGMYGRDAFFSLGFLSSALFHAGNHEKFILLFEEINALAPAAQKMLNGLLDLKQGMAIKELGMRLSWNGNKPLIIGTMNPCFHPETDVLTPDGIKKVSDLKIGDKVYSKNLQTEEMEIDEISNIASHHHSDGLFEISNQHVRLRITKNHRIVTKKTHGKWGAIPVEDVAKEMETKSVAYRYYPKPFNFPDGEDSDVINILLDNSWKPNTNKKFAYTSAYKVDDFLSLLGWYVSEGHLQNNDGYKVCISQQENVNKENLDAIKALLERMKISWNETVSLGVVKGVYFYDKILFHALEFFGGKGSESKKIHHSLFKFNKKHLGYLFDSLYKGDGDVIKPRENSKFKFRSMRYSTKSPQLRDDIVWLANYLGYTTTVGFDSGCFRIGMRKAKSETCTLDFDEIPYDGLVFDVEVRKNHNLYAGDDGRFLCVSNSHFGGVFNLNADLKSRFNFYKMGHPSADIERKILSKHLADEHLIEKLVRIAGETRSGDFLYQVSTRDLVEVARLVTNKVPLEVALRLLAGKFDENFSAFCDRVTGIFAIRLISTDGGVK